MEVRFFANQQEFREWLAVNHDKEKSLIAGYYKVKTGKPSMTWSQSVDEALSFGWIDGIRRSIDEESYCIRFTPRNPGSIWSKINIRKAEDLISKGLMQESGLVLYQNRKVERTELYSYENKQGILPSDFELKFMKEPEAWIFFSKQPPSYRKMACLWILSAKQETTRIRRLSKLIDESRMGHRLFV